MNVNQIFGWLRQAAICVLLIMGPAFWLAPPVFWKLAPTQWAVLAGSVVAYLLCLRSARSAAGGSVSPGTLALRYCAFFGLWVLAIMLCESGLLGFTLPAYSRAALVAGLVIGLVGLFLTAWSKPLAWPVLAVIAIGGLVALAGQAAFQKRWLPRPPLPRQLVTMLDTSLYQLKLTKYVDTLPHHWRQGGGIEPWGDDFLVVTGDGRLIVFNEDSANATLRFKLLPTTVPLNADEFEAGAHEIFSNTPNNYVESSRFRVAGVRVQNNGELRRVLVAHHHWDVANKCFTMRLSALEGTTAQLAEETLPAWRTVYDAAPCLALNTTNPSGPRFEGLENGGSIVELGADEILLSVGDHGFDGVTRPENLSQDPATQYGKIMRVNIATGAAQIYSSGHRNPQGLHLAADGTLWSTEHGPRGGDELNRITEGSDYGWPSVTFGTDYSRRTWPLNPNAGRHDAFVEPVYAFVPSVGISRLTSVNSEKFAEWRGDLMIGSLKGETLFRTRIRDGHVMFAEPLPMGGRVRDVDFTPDGRLVMWFDDSSVAFLEPTAVNAGEALAGQCRACHGFSVWDSSTALGPNIGEIVGRRVASRTDFIYSEAMKDHGGSWTRERLDAFLANPQAAVPGTAMVFPGMPDAAQRQLLIDYLQNTARVD